MGNPLTKEEAREYDIIRKIILKNVQFHTATGYIGVNTEVVQQLKDHFKKEEKPNGI